MAMLDFFVEATLAQQSVRPIEYFKGNAPDDQKLAAAKARAHEIAHEIGATGGGAETIVRVVAVDGGRVHAAVQVQAVPTDGRPYRVIELYD